MKPVFCIAFAALLPLAVLAQEANDAAAAEAAATPAFAPVEASEVDLNEFVWKKRPVVVFADTPDDPAFLEQMRMMEALPEELAARDVVVIVDTDPSARTQARTKLRPRGFSLVLLDKDGAVKLRKPFPWDTRELTRAIDKMPIRQEELRTRRFGN